MSINIILTVRTSAKQELVDITALVEDAVIASGVTEGLVNIYVRGATAAIHDTGELGRFGSE